MKPMANGSAHQRSSSKESAPALSEEKASLAGAADSLAESPREKIVRDMIRGLFDGRYKPGQRLVEAHLTAAHGVSRGPVREAFNRLAAMGAVELTLQSGAKIRKLTIGEAIDILVLTAGLSKIAVQLAIERVTDEDILRLQEAHDQLVQFDPAINSPDFALARNQFYDTLIRLGGNKELSRIVPFIQVHIIRVQYETLLQTSAAQRHAPYTRIMKAMKARDLRASEQAIQRHFDEGIQALKAAMAP